MFLDHEETYDKETKINAIDFQQFNTRPQKTTITYFFGLSVQSF